MDKTYLAKQLDEMKLQAASTWQQREKARKAVYRTLAAAYLNWRDASLLPDWLEGEYKKAGITYRAKENNELNFRPFIRLIFGFIKPTRYEENKISDYDATLIQLDREFTSNPKAYQANAVNKLASYIDMCGGVGGVKKDYASEAHTDPNENFDEKDEKRLAKKKQSDDELANRSIDVLAKSASKGIGIAQARQHVRTDENNLVVLMGRREADGGITILGASNNSEAISVAAIHTAQRNLALVPYNVRLLAEIISTQMYPRIGKPKTKDQQRAWYKRILLDKTGLKLSRIHKIKRDDIDLSNDELSNPRALLMRPVWEDVILSSLRSPRSVVTQCKPRTFIGDKKEAIFLKTNERNYLEDYIENGEIELMSSTPSSSLLRVADQKYSYKITIENKYNRTKKDFHFYKLYRPEHNPIMKQQTEFHFFSFKPKWTCVADIGWFEKLRAEWLDEWFMTLGKNTQLARENNATFDVIITSSAIRFTYNMDETGLAPARRADISTKLADGLKQHRVVVRSKDLAPILFNIADMAIHGSIKLSGDEDAIVFEFETDVGDYKIAVPSFDRKRAKSRVQRGLFYLTRAAV